METFGDGYCAICFEGVIGSELGVRYSSPAICALEGSSVNMFCSYTDPHGEIIHNVSWVNAKGSTDVTLDPFHKNQVHVDCEDKGHKCNLQIKNVTKSDASMYYCRILTSDEEFNMTNKQGVQLSITGKEQIESVY